MAKIRITQVKSKIDCAKRQRATLVALGIKKVNHSVEKETTPEIMGMVRTVSHLVKVEEI